MSTDDSELAALTVKELQARLKTRGLETTGKKADLIKRLSDAQQESASASKRSAPEADSSSPVSEAVEEPASKRAKVSDVGDDEDYSTEDVKPAHVDAPSVEPVAPVVQSDSVNQTPVAAPPIAVENTSSSNGNCILRVDNFMRPFPLVAAKALFEAHGVVVDFWLNSIRSTAIVQFDSSQAAETARAAVDGLHWPDTSPKTLSAAFISALDASQLKTSLVSSLSIKKPDTQQLMKAVASTKQQPARVEPPRVVKSVESSLDRNTNSKSFTITARSVVSEQVAALATFELEQSGRSVVDTDAIRQADREQRLAEEAARQEANAKRRAENRARLDAEERVKLESLKTRLRSQFRLTEAEPRIFYLPLTSAQAAAKGNHSRPEQRKAKRSRSQSPRGRHGHGRR